MFLPHLTLNGQYGLQVDCAFHVLNPGNQKILLAKFPASHSNAAKLPSLETPPIFWCLPKIFPRQDFKIRFSCQDVQQRLNSYLAN